MAETSIYRTKRASKTASKGQSEFYRHVILPSKTYKEKHQLPATEVKDAAMTYKKQAPLGKADIEKLRTSSPRQLSIDMLRQGYHQSFRELYALLAWQKQDRERLGPEHPFHRRPLLDGELDKFRFLCVYLSKAEEAERRCQYSNMYRNYLAIGAFFLKTDDYWLSDFYYNKCLSFAQTHTQLDTELVAQAHLNIGLSYERQGDFLKALQSFENYLQTGENYYESKTDANLQLVRIYMKLAEHRADNRALDYMIKAYEASTQSDNKKVEHEISYKLGSIYLEHDDIDSALTYLQRYYDYCEQVDDEEGFGQASEMLAICYQKKLNVEKSTEYLTKYIEKVSGNKGSNQYAKAFSALGLIDVTLGHFDSAMASASKAYSISLANVHSDLERNRVLYGIATGLKLRSVFNDHVNQKSVDGLLQWKQTRLEKDLTKSKT